MPVVKRDVSDAVGFHFRLEQLDEYGSAVEVDAFRIHTEGQVFLELFGSRGSDSRMDSVVVALPLAWVGPVTQALAGAARYLQQHGTVQ